MRITNRSNLPEAIVRAVMNDKYTRGDADYSVTGLLKPPRISALERMHADELEEDVSDRVWALFGQAIHSILERSEIEAIAEKRLYASINGVRVSGQMDRFVLKDGHLTDYKTTSVWKILKGTPTEYIEQENSYAELIRQNNAPITKMDVVALLRDWSKREALRNEFYPKTQVETIPIPLWPQAEAYDFLSTRIKLHESAKKDLPLCSDEDRWATQAKWAVMKKGRKSAVRLLDSKEAAEEMASSQKDGYVEFRPGENKRCESYCAVAKFCSQYQALKAAVTSE